MAKTWAKVTGLVACVGAVLGPKRSTAAAEGFPLLVKPYTMEALGDVLGQALRAARR